MAELPERDSALLLDMLLAFGSTRPIVAALVERGDAVSDRVYKGPSLYRLASMWLRSTG